MAKRKRTRQSQVARDLYTGYRYSRSAMRTVSSPSVMSTLRLIPLGDGRFFHPSPMLTRPFAAAPRSAARLVAKGTGIKFADPKGVLTCVRRGIRREVLFALGVGGQGGRKRKPRFTAASKISCV